jgi:hypothetical protein
VNLTVSRDKLDTALGHKVGSLLGTVNDIPLIECTENHHFGPGIYIKEVTMPAGALIVGKVHKVEHMCVMLTGRMILVQEDGSRTEIKAPATFVAKPGRKVAYIIETTIFQNIYSTDETDLEKLENMFIDNSKNLLGEGN